MSNIWNSSVRIAKTPQDLDEINKSMLLKLQERKVQTMLSTLRGKDCTNLPEKLYKIKLGEL